MDKLSFLRLWSFLPFFCRFMKKKLPGAFTFEAASLERNVSHSTEHCARNITSESITLSKAISRKVNFRVMLLFLFIVPERLTRRCLMLKLKKNLLPFCDSLAVMSLSCAVKRQVSLAFKKASQYSKTWLIEKLWNLFLFSFLSVLLFHNRHNAYWNPVLVYSGF